MQYLTSGIFGSSSTVQPYQQLQMTWAPCLLQIVANDDNGVDVDKLDYLRRDAHECGMGYGHDFGPILDNCRVINDWLCFKDVMRPKLKALFDARIGMHEEVYYHRKVKSAEYMLVDALLHANSSLRITDRIHE